MRRRGVVQACTSAASNRQQAGLHRAAHVPHVPLPRSPAGKGKEASARSCHQEVVRRAKAAQAAARAAAAADATSGKPSSEASTGGGGGSSTGGAGAGDANVASAATPLPAEAAAATQGSPSLPISAPLPPAADAPAAPACVPWIPDLNGYLAAAEVVLQLQLPHLATQLLEAAAGGARAAPCSRIADSGATWHA